MGPYSTVDDAIAQFKKKFKDKTSNNWDDRDRFQAKSGWRALAPGRQWCMRCVCVCVCVLQ